MKKYSGIDNLQSIRNLKKLKHLLQIYERSEDLICLDAMQNILLQISKYPFDTLIYDSNDGFMYLAWNGTDCLLNKQIL